MKLRNILGVSALTLLLGVSVSGVSANADGAKLVTTPSTSKANQNTTEGNLSLNTVPELDFNSIDLTQNTDSQSTRNVGVNNNPSVTLNNRTASDSINWNLSISGDTLKASGNNDVNGATIKDGDKSAILGNNKSSLEVAKGDSKTPTKKTDNVPESMDKLTLSIPYNYNMPQTSNKKS
ncbi:hypothetical protein DY124_04860 [Apilactobacillus micheneri]|uniref:WxL domain-containing protein n=1 Tax=Apilactobacillus micheneri TaxID=1899430 RepID=UPI001127A180|nr:WxL domain-containing protein [Apilactobacillus micheneri]TPR43927.1 hypothetical protein DY124_04860 [Apilactobacillus micheneri]TPR47699.1 hypothetical protein DY125_04860 [Apilactobacillus micheneri]